MARQNINVGTTANDGTGDPIRTAMTKINDNFVEIYSGNFANNLNANSLVIGNGTTTQTSSGITVSNTAGNVQITPTRILATGNINAASHTVGSIFVANTTGIYNTTNTFNLGANTNAANGFTFLPNGFRLNWGWVSANNSAGNATFTSAYTTNAYVVTATSNSAVATYQAAVIGTNSSVVAIRTANAASTNVFWMAIGF